MTRTELSEHLNIPSNEEGEPLWSNVDPDTIINLINQESEFIALKRDIYNIISYDDIAEYDKRLCVPFIRKHESAR